MKTKPVLAKCECQHDVHFYRLEIRGNVHSYGAIQEVKPFDAGLGKFNACQDCHETCLAHLRKTV